MIHYGDITQISGYNVPIVDTVIFGAPCQDLSVAGKRMGMKHTDMGDDETTRSGLFHEAIRIIKEMRAKDERNRRTGQFIRPRFAVYENVPGAFSSNKGQDFRIVLESLAQVIDKSTIIPMPPKDKWSTSGAIVGDGWSIAWRVFDAQFWGATYFDDDGVPIKLGTPQRRRRISLVADFGGGCAPEILFERNGLRGYLEESGTQRKATPTDAQGGIGADDREGTCYSIENHPNDSRVKIDNEGKVQALTSRMGTGGGNVPMVMTPFCKSARARSSDDATTWKHADVANTLNVFGQGEARANELVVEEHPVICLQGNGIDRADTAGCNGKGWKEDTSYTLNTVDRPAVVYALDRASFNQGENAQYDFEISDSGVNSTIVAKGPSAVCYGSVVDMTHPHYIVRRLTPLECERLQGYPDRWTDIGEYIDSNGKKKKTSDSARYKALGNSIALPPWKWVLKRLCSHYERDATMASLFDGIGGFPHLWEQLNGKGSCLWASEIEDFPIAVTTVRIE